MLLAIDLVNYNFRYMNSFEYWQMVFKILGELDIG